MNRIAAFSHISSNSLTPRTICSLSISSAEFLKDCEHRLSIIMNNFIYSVYSHSINKKMTLFTINTILSIIIDK